MILGKVICTFIGHDGKYRHKVRTSDGKIFEIKVCSRCWKESKKEVK